MKHWLVLRVGSRKEKLVRASLEVAGIECFVPLREKQISYASKRVVRHLPVIPGYVFVRVDKTKTGTVLSIPFANGFLRTGGVYDRISERELQRLRQLCNNTLVAWSNEALQDPIPSVPGSLVEIIRGPLTGLRGYFLSEVNRNTFRITLGLIETQLTTCDIDISDVMPITGSSVSELPSQRA
ncbi:MAG: transcription termination/antitermination protein NusG [Lewinella sp.]